MSLKVVWTTKFKRDYKRAMKRGLDMNRLDGGFERWLQAGSLLSCIGIMLSEVSGGGIVSVTFSPTGC